MRRKCRGAAGSTATPPCRRTARTFRRSVERNDRMSRVPGADLLDELTWRGLVAHSTDLDVLRRELADGPVTLYYGCDPTAPSLHVGNLVGLIGLGWFQQAGHRPSALAGGATGFIGDPGGRSSERTLLSAEEVERNVERIAGQLSHFVDLSDRRGLLANNMEWTAGMSVIDFLRDIGKHFPVNV